MNSAGNQFFSAKNCVYILIAINTLVFMLLPAGSRLWVYEFALSSYGIAHFKIWQFVTYMFLHAGFAHVFFNMWGLYLFGSAIMPILGPSRFLTLYFLSGVSGAGLWLLLNWGSRVPIVGASGAVFGVMMAAAMLFPDMRIQLLFPPIPMKMKTFVSVYAVIEIVSELSSSQGGVAHLAHLGGFISAYFYLKFLYKNRVWDMFGVFRSLKRKKKTPRSTPASKLPEGWKVYSNPVSSPVSKEEVDRILDKISARGIKSLTQEELDILKRASGGMKH